MSLDPESLHDWDWLKTKARETFFEDAPRYPYIADVVTGLRPHRLLDLGCGSGYLAKLLKMRIPELVVHGIDISSVALQRARRYLDQVWQVDLDKADLPAAAEHYDTVACVEVLEHLYDPDHALQEMARVLVPERPRFGRSHHGRCGVLRGTYRHVHALGHLYREGRTAVLKEEELCLRGCRWGNRAVAVVRAR